MESNKYYTTSDGTIIDERYVQNTLNEFDVLVEKSGIVPEKCACTNDYHRINFNELPKEIQIELEPFILHV
jgi:hypothetical protein